MMLHMWYSALIPVQMLLSLQEKLLHLIEDVCSKIRDEGAEAMWLQAKAWRIGNPSIAVGFLQGNVG
jgi:hypothetical protein